MKKALCLAAFASLTLVSAWLALPAPAEAG